MGPLLPRFGESITFNLGKLVQAKVAFIIRGQWCWPRRRKRNSTIQFVIAYSSLMLLPDESRDDFVICLPQGYGDFSVDFSVKSAWESMREMYYRLA